MLTQQDFADKFENYLLEHMSEIGMICKRNPELENASTPDFLVEHDGKRCYVEATHLRGPDEFREKRGEEELRKLLDANVPKGWTIVLEYPHDETKRLTNQISKADRGISHIVDCLQDAEHPREEERRLELPIGGVRVDIHACPDPTAAESRVAWIKSDSWSGSPGKRRENLRRKLKLKYDKYTPEPDSLGDVPLIIAVFVEVIDRREMFEALYGTRTPYLTLDRNTYKVLESCTRTENDGVWLNGKGGELKIHNNHLAGVWHFRSMKDPRMPALLFHNPYTSDISSIIPDPILSTAS